MKNLLAACAAVICFAPAHIVIAEIMANPPYEPPGPGPSAHWKQIAPGLHGAFGSIDNRYERHTPPELPHNNAWTGAAWRGERAGAQIVLWTADGAEQVRIKTAPLQGGNATAIPPTAVTARFVRYVLADGKLIGDILDTIDRLDIPAQTTRPVWLSIDVPRKTAPGLYKGSVEVFAKGRPSLKFDINLEVLPMTLPKPSEWYFHLDLWQNPFAVARYHHVRPWSEEHFRLLRPHLEMLADAGQKCLTTTIVYRPWGTQTYDPYDSMVRWIRRADGSFQYDYTIFDKYVRFGQKCGITKQINCYSMVPWTNAFRYYDEQTGNYELQKAEAGAAEYEKLWRPFLKDFVGHLRENGWLEKTTIAMDERPLETMRKVIALVKQTAPELKLTLAVNYQPKVKIDIYDLSAAIGHPLEPDFVEERIMQSRPTTFYVCCGPARPNTFPSSPPAESTWMGFYAAARNYSGFLRWAYDSWVADPLYDTSHVTWTAGDCFLVYPGLRSSIRFERLREGIAHYEKIRILRKTFQKAGTPKAGNALKQLNEMLTTFTFKSAQKNPAEKTVNNTKKILTQLSRASVHK